MFHTIRFRLTLWYSGILFAGLFLFGLFLWVLLRQQLLADVDDQLEQRLQGVHAVFNDEGALGNWEQLREELTEYAHATPEGTLIHVRDDSGQPWLPGQALATPEIWKGDLPATKTVLTPRRVRIRAARLSLASRPFDVEVGADLQAMDRMLMRFRRLLLIAIPFVVSVAFVAGYWISGRALAPVDEITASAKRISLENLSERLPVLGNDELQRLSETWNEMLSRLESAVQRIKTFTADASHELRTSIAVILTTAEIALRRNRDAEEYRRSLHEIKAEAERITDLTENLLMLARADAPQQKVDFKRIEIKELALQVVAETGAAAREKHVRLEAKLDGPTDVMYGNPAALRRLFLILLDNSLKYTASGGSIEVTTSRDDQTIVISVRDTGRGIDSSDLPHIFERFYRADKSRSGPNGSGLGLSIAQSIAQMHGGRIQVESTPGLGSRFDVLLPL